MRKEIHQHMNATIEAAEAAGMSYGAYVAETTHPVIVTVPAHLVDAPTMWERLAGAVPPPAPRYEHVRKAESTGKQMEQHRARVNNGFVDAPWLRSKRKTAKMSTERLAKLCDVHRNTVVAWESDERVPVHMVERINNVLDSCINYGRPVLYDNE